MKKWKLFLLTMATSILAVAAPAMAADEEAMEEVAEEVVEEVYEYEDPFPNWNEDAASLNTLIEFVEDVTDESSENFIPEEDRIAVFDMDGTLYAELFPTYIEYYMLAWRILKDPNIEPDAEMLDLGRELRESVISGSFASDMPIRHAIQAARAYSTLTMDEFYDFCTEVLLREADGFEGMTYGEAFYQPMIDVVEYLQDNGFTCFVSSGSDRYLCRTLLEGAFDIPFSNIIGMDVQLVASGQEDTAGMDYIYTADDEVIRSDALLVKNLKMNKVSGIVKEIGKQPVLSFGNTSGDVSMHNYVINDNPHRSAAFMLIADDEERDYGNEEKAQSLKEQWEESGYNVISMKNDFKTIYPEGVVKTGTFRWADEMAEDRVPAETLTINGVEVTGKAALPNETVSDPNEEDETDVADDADGTDVTDDAEEDDVAEETDDTSGNAFADTQYVLYLGTNDKDTNKPVFTSEEARQILREILLDRFGGYTIQEAYGGWIDGGGEQCQEYTLMIYLSDAALEDVHAVADELITTFNQSTIMIKAEDVTTEFYSGNH